MSAAPNEHPAHPSSEKRDDLSGQSIDRYRLETLLGAGGMGRVYSAVHAVTQRRCALKILPDELCRQPDFVSRFNVEAQTLARLNHPNVVQIYTGGEAQGRFFLEMEYVDGGDLQRRVQDQMAATGQGLPEEEARRVADGILAALEYAHDAGIVHRDLKPANILLSKDGVVKVSDFGLATVVGEDLHRTRIQQSVNFSLSLTKVTSMETMVAPAAGASAGFAGTILYMSPQALRSEPPDHRDDLFSFGVLVYFMLTGRTPSVNYTPVSRVRRNLGRDWDKFIATCLAEERAARYSNAKEARKALPRAGARKPVALAVYVTAGVLALGVVGYLVVKRLPSTAPSGDPGTTTTSTATTTTTTPTGAPTGPATVLLENQTIAFAAVGDATVGAPPFALNAIASSRLPVSFAVVSGPARVAENIVTVTGPGVVVIRASQPGNERYAPAPALETMFRVVEAAPTAPAQKKTQTIAFETLPDRIFGQPSFELVARSSSGLPISFSVVGGPATSVGNIVTLTGIGRVTIRADQPGDSAFLAAASVEQSFVSQDIVPPKLTVSLPGKIELTLVRIPAGRAVLGSPENELGRRNDEAQRNYTRADPFLMAVTEITQAQYQAIASTRPSYYRRDWANRPVEQIRFSDLTESTNATSRGFIAKLNAHLQANGYPQWEAALPSEEEWEYACRAGTETALNNGTNLSSAVRDNNAAQVAIYSRSETAPVATLAPNAWGLYDMHGNVAEWTREGVLRGGAFRDDASACRSASRLRGKEDSSSADSRFGFRVIFRPIVKK